VKHPGSAKLEILLPNLLGLKELNNNRTLCGKGILGWYQVIFTIKGRISGVNERKNTCELDFSISNKTGLPSPNYVPRGKTVTAAYLHKALATIDSCFWAKKTKHVCTELVFGQASAPKAIAASFFNNWLWKNA
jgi:hypothetical protein